MPMHLPPPYQVLASACDALFCLLNRSPPARLLFLRRRGIAELNECLRRRTAKGRCVWGVRPRLAAPGASERICRLEAALGTRAEGPSGSGARREALVPRPPSPGPTPPTSLAASDPCLPPPKVRLQHRDQDDDAAGDLRARV